MDSQDNTNKVDNEEAALQALIKSKISQIENAEGLVTKAQLKEMTALVTSLLSNTEMPTEEKVKQINAKYEKALQDVTAANAEKEKVYVQLSKVNKLKDKLEILCRELQKQNKTIIDESKRIAEDEQTKRNDLSKKFHETIQQITVKMDEQAEERLKLVKENEMLREKMLNFAEQYEIREKHFETQAKAKDLELQLVGAKLKQQTEIAIQESVRAKAYNEQITTLTSREKELSTQLAYYAEKFEQFQDTLTKSNDIFTTFKQEMEKMAKTIKKGEKENAELKKKCEQTDVALISLAEEKNTLKKQIEQNAVQKKKLEELCRVLQTERTQLRQEIADKNNATTTTTSETNNNVQEVKQ